MVQIHRQVMDAEIFALLAQKGQFGESFKYKKLQRYDKQESMKKDFREKPNRAVLSAV